MTGLTALEELLTSMQPQLMDNEYVFCTVKGSLSDYVSMKPIATFQEKEGLTLVLKREEAQQHHLAFDGIFKLISLTVHSSLDAVGLTAAISSKLASKNISANVIAAYYHDHIFVQSEHANEAMAALQALSH